MEAVTLASLLTVGGVALIVTILMQVAKKWMSSSAVPGVAVILAGPAIALAASFALGQRNAQQLGQAVLTGFLGGAGAVSLSQVQKPSGLLGPKS